MSKLIPTREFAARVGVQSETVRRQARANGSYYGSVPTKAENGQLRWPIPKQQSK